MDLGLMSAPPTELPLFEQDVRSVHENHSSAFSRISDFTRTRIGKVTLTLLAIGAFVGTPAISEAIAGAPTSYSAAPVAPPDEQLNSGFSPVGGTLNNLEAAAVFIAPDRPNPIVTANSASGKDSIKEKTTANSQAGSAAVFVAPAPETRQVSVNSKGKSTKTQFLDTIFRGADSVLPGNLAPSPDKKITLEKLTLQGVPLESVAIFEQFRPKIEASWPIYVAAGKAEGIRPELIAAVHNREAGNDPNRSVWSGQDLGTANWDHGDDKGKTLIEDATKAAHHLKVMAKGVYGIDLGMNNSLDEYKHTLIAYNRGSWYRDYGTDIEASPYINRGYRPDTLSMIWPDSPAEPSAVRGSPNVALGTLVVLSGLGMEVRK